MTFCDLVIRIASAEKKVWEIRVTIKGGIFNFATNTPLMAPIKMPTTSIIIIPSTVVRISG